MPPPHASPEVAARYRHWLDEAVLDPLAEDDPQAFAWLIEWAKELTSRVVAQSKSLGAQS
jgi:hypothetical protein